MTRFVCDSQVHAPAQLPGTSIVPGIDGPDLVKLMATVGVDRAVLVPLGGDNDACFRICAEHPERFGVMGVPPVEQGPSCYDLVRGWLGRQGMLGLRVSFFAKTHRTLLTGGELDWLWRAAERDRLPIMMNVPNCVPAVAAIASRYPDLRIVIDHMGLTPFVPYVNFDEVLKPVLALAAYANVAIKASALPSSVTEDFPFPSLREPVRAVIEEFGVRRVFWGSDLTRVACTYEEIVTFFTNGMDFLTKDEMSWVMGRGICEWLGWPLTGRQAVTRWPGDVQ